MKIAVVSDDHSTICAHFGRAVYYEVFNISDGKVTGHETLPKASHDRSANEPYADPGFAHGQGSAEENLHTRMFAPILDCQVLLAGGMGKGAYNGLKQAGVRPVLTDMRDIEQAVKSYLEGTLTDHPELLHTGHGGIL
ncbi:MAG: NifB/NifX family molybdenum-iron cluster-binding protein [Anaerolineales bacterium]|jgi:predicted Fe-Mo cluster-binding NifX family protein